MPAAPPTLFKYVDPEGAKKILEGRTLKYSAPGSFNDPFDLRAGELLRGGSAAFASAMPKAFLDFLSSPIEAPRIRPKARGLLTVFLNAIDRMDEDGLRKFSDELLSSTDLYAPDQLQATAESATRAIQATLDRFGVLCLSAVPDNALMWAHYARSHSGAVLEFAPSIPKDSALLTARPVVYADERPCVYETADQLIRNYFLEDDDVREAYLYKVLDTKHASWSYEQEYRVTIPDLIQDGRGFELLKFYPEELVGLYLGSRMSNDDRTDVVGVAQQLRPGVKVHQARLDTHGYTISFEPR